MIARPRVAVKSTPGSGPLFCRQTAGKQRSWLTILSMNTGDAQTSAIDVPWIMCAPVSRVMGY
jgi:hypothetical protein